MRVRGRAAIAAGAVVLLAAGAYVVDVYVPIAETEPRGELELFVRGPDPATKAAAIAQSRDQERVVERCMARAGFEYRGSWPRFWEMHVERGSTPGSVAFAERYGYGQWVEAPSSGIHWGFARPAWNAKYTATLSEPDREAYDAAFTGPDGQGGCLMIGQGWTGDAELDAVIVAAGELVGTIADDDAVADLESEWSRCMATAGHDFASPDDAFEAVTAGMVEAFEAAGLEEDFREGSEAQGKAELEIAVAVADAQCREDLDYDARYREVSHRLQAEWAQQHRAQIEAVEAARAQL